MLEGNFLMNISKSRNRLDSDFKPKITVVGVGGGGGNAVNNMIKSQLEGVEFVAMNTDYQALSQSLTDVDRRVQLGNELTKGLGAGSAPEVGRASAEESIEEINEQIHGSNMVFIAAGMGGGTGTGTAPVIARVAREKGILTVGVVTKPFHFEGSQRMRSADRGIEELQKYVDTLIIIPNQNLFRIANEQTTFADAFRMADDVLYAGVRGITDLMIMPGLINLDFADVRAVMSEMGKAMMGTGEAESEGRAIAAAEAAISNPLLDDVSMKGAQGVLINITGGMDMTLYEVDEAANRIREEVDPEANIIFGSTFDERLNGRMRVSVVATGIDGVHNKESPRTVFSTKPAATIARANRFHNEGTSATTRTQTPTPEAEVDGEQSHATEHLRVISGNDTDTTDAPHAPATSPFEPDDDMQQKPKVGFFSRLLGRKSQPESNVVQARFKRPDKETEMNLFTHSSPAPSARSGEHPAMPHGKEPNELKEKNLDVKEEEDLDIPSFMRRT